MQAHLNGKPVLSLRYRAQIDDLACLENVWHPETGNCQNCEWILGTSTAINTKLESIYDIVQDNQVLYFGKTSRFPRFKLSESKLKRTIKTEKASIFVIGDIDYTIGRADYLLEDELAYYVVDKYYISNRISTSSATARNEWDSDWFKYIQDKHLFYGAEIKKVDNVTYIKCSAKVAFDLNNIMNNTYTKLITDKMLDEFVNKKFDVLTKDDVDSICDMLDSDDDAIRGMGLKMLTGFNVQETPVTVRIMLGIRPRLKYCNEWTSTGVRQIRESINWEGFGDFPYNTYDIIQFKEDQPISEYDKSLCRNIVVEQELKYLQYYIERLKDSTAAKVFNLDISCNVS